MTKEIPLSQGKIALVDDEDYERVVQLKWYYDGRYVSNCDNKRGRGVRLHRFIMNAPAGVDVDHRDLNKLNCQKSNLRLATRQQNTQSQPKRRINNGTSRFKGVSYERRRGWWVAQICLDYKTKYLGSFHNEEEAARAYDRAARQYFGEFALVNFPDEQSEVQEH